MGSVWLWLRRRLRRAAFPGQELPITRFIYSKSHIRRSEHRPKPGAFLPPPDLRTSILQTLGLVPTEIWERGRNLRSDKTLRGRADLTTLDVAAVGELKVDIDNVPPRHGDIVGWPELKDAQVSLAQDLVDSSILHLPD